MTSLAQSNAANGFDIILDTNGNIALVSGKDAYAHILADVVRTLEGELQLDTEAGIPYERTIWSSIKNVSLWQHYVSEAVSKLPFISDITNFTAEVISGNILTYELTVVLTSDDTVTIKQ